MLTDKGLEQTIRKLRRFLNTLQQKIFIPIGTIKPELYETKEPLHQIPEERLFHPIQKNTWGGEGVYGWFCGNYTVPEAADGRALFLWPKMGYFEATLWLNGKIHSNYAAKFTVGSHGNHYCNRLVPQAKNGEVLRVALECYAYHQVLGTQPIENVNSTCYEYADGNFEYATGDMEICLRDDELMDFMFDLSTLLSLRDALEERSFRRAEVENALYEAHLRLLYDPNACTEEAFRAAIRSAAPLLKEQLSRKNGGEVPFVGLTGHSHMDTAWLWPLTETEKKCARTYANQLNLMEEYPEYRFIQSSAYHSDVIRRKYPELFTRIQKAVASGRYEPNGGVWVECDCNLTGGESMIRQFLWGQRFTRKYFHYTADCFWLPDTFGYSVAIPQIMRGCDISYFLTTKMAWNDTNVFPYTSFYWQGLDGTRVLTHLNRGHIGPTPETLHEITDGDDFIRENRTSDMRLFSYGKGDGGGGPEFEMIESARRLHDLDGVPRCADISVSEFMHRLEEKIHRPSVFAGELYLELHRGTLTNQHEIKRGNRLCEIALHNLEWATVMNAVREQKPADGTAVAPLMNQLLIHQFHDILPGTCIHSVHEETKRTIADTIDQAEKMTNALLPKSDQDKCITLWNPLSFDRNDTVYVDALGEAVEEYVSQPFVDLEGRERLAIAGLSLPAFGSKALRFSKLTKPMASPFILEGQHLTTPFAEICFSESGFIESLIDRRTGRELVQGLPFNTFLMAEDVSAAWDNWDIDADLEEKMQPVGRLLSRQVVSNGPVELRIRSLWAISEKSTIEQDMVFSAGTPLISFETVMNWQEEHHFLKAAFDTSLHCDDLRSEVQFGCIRRTVHRSTDIEKARFEICNHKYSDLSEPHYGIALLNDCKYGLSANEGSMRLSLHKGGIRPDIAGDKGRHICRYAILPHCESFGAKSVVEPAYAFNYHPLIQPGTYEAPAFVTADADNVVIETIKPCEDTERAYILRLYEATSDYAVARLSFAHPVRKLVLCNMLEEEEKPLEKLELTVKPFQICTLKVCY